MRFLPENYRKAIYKEKIFRLLAAFLFLIFVALIIGSVFALPSYFALILSKDDVVRRLQAEENTLSRREIKKTEQQILAINKQILNFTNNESKRHKISPILTEIINSTPPAIQILNLDFKKSSQGGDTFVISLNGEVATRDDLLAYIEKLKTISRFSGIDSPLTNLLHATKISFSLNINIKPEFYKHASSQ